MAFGVSTGNLHCGLKLCCDTVFVVATRLGELVSR